MNPFKLIRKLGKVLRGGATSREMFLGVFLGFAIGMTPGVNLTLIGLIVLFLFLNANGALGALSILLGKALCLSLAPVTYRIGHMMIHSLGLGGLVRAAGDTPVLALLDLHVYCLMGAIPIVLVVGIPLAWFVGRSVGAMRAGVAKAAGGSEKLQKVASNKFARFVLRVVFGKQKGAFAEMAGRKSSLIRLGRVIVAAVFLGVLVAAWLIFLNPMVKSGLAKSIGAANGAEVDIASADLSLGSGRLVIEGLQVTDPARPKLNRVQAERLEAKISISDLLARRFVVDVLACDAMRFDAQRATPGEVYSDVAPAKEEGPDLGGLIGNAKEYLDQFERTKEKFQKVRDYLKSDDPAKKGPANQEDVAERARAEGYLRLSAKDMLTKQPTWVIRKVTLNNIEVRGVTFSAEGANLSSHPSLYPEKMTLEPKLDRDQLAKLPGADKVVGALGKLLGGKTDEAAKTDGDGKKKGLLEGLLNR
ncbi:MAG TPA: hypothetical protein VFJ30_03225 [Phycisphaerae bacterium]|nr:hypothetical protein [Phycisphaerae bacterium]